MELQLIAVVTSILAILISGFNLGWNIYKDAIRTPKFRVTIAVKKIVQRGQSEDGPHVFLEALNIGPASNRIGLPFARKGWLQRKIFDRKGGSAMIYPDFSHMAATKSAARIEVGDTATFIFPYSASSFLKEPFTRIGVSDGFGRLHWASRKDLRRARTKFAKRFHVGNVKADE